MSIKNQRKAKPIRSRACAVRLYDEEWAALVQFADQLGQTPSRIVRRLLREALTGGPDYFTDELRDVDKMSWELNAIGRNLNQLVKAANRGEVVEAAEIKRVANATRVQVAAVGQRFDQAIKTVTKRRAAALSWKDDEGQE